MVGPQVRLPRKRGGPKGHKLKHQVAETLDSVAPCSGENRGWGQCWAGGHRVQRAAPTLHGLDGGQADDVPSRWENVSGRLS